MVIELAEYMNTVGHTIKKENIVKTLDFIMNSIDNDIIPMIKGVSKSQSKVIQENIMLNNIRNNIKEIKTKDNIEFFDKLGILFIDIHKKEKDLNNLVMSEFEDFTAKEAVTVKQASILKVINDFGSMTLYMADFSYFVMIDMDETAYPKIKVNNIRNGVSTFSEMLRCYYGNISTVVGTLPKVSDMILNTKDNNKLSILETLIGKSGKKINIPGASGFIGGISYAIRMRLIDAEIKKYEALKEKRKLVELRLMELKLAENNVGNPKLAKQIEYYEEKLAKIDYNIQQIEKVD